MTPKRAQDCHTASLPAFVVIRYLSI